MRTFLILLSVFALSQTVSAAPTSQLDAMQAALDSRDEFISALKNRDFTDITHHAFDVAIRELAQELRDVQKDEVLADDLLNRWTQSSAVFADQIEAVLARRDLGDHPPLLPWIQDFLKTTSEKYGTIIYSLQIVKNIEMLNFAIPVVFAPHGAWQSTTVNNRIEYRKHFIPFVNLVTYYVSLYGCKYVLAHQGVTTGASQLCTKAAIKLEFVMGRYIAPLVSDWIYKEGNQALEINQNHLRYTTAEQLQHAIQH